MNKQELETLAHKIVTDAKGILAADESLPTIKKRFDTIQVESTEENRRAYRELLFTTQGMEDFISDVILFDETVRHATQVGVLFVELLSQKGVVPGIKVDKGAKDLAGFVGENITEGLDGLRDRLIEYIKLISILSFPKHSFLRLQGCSLKVPFIGLSGVTPNCSCCQIRCIANTGFYQKTCYWFSDR